MNIYIVVAISGSLLGGIVWVYIWQSESDITDSQKDVGDSKVVLPVSEDTTQPKTIHEKLAQENDVNYTEILALIESLRKEMYLINISASLMNNNNPNLNETQSDSLVVMEHVKNEFREHMKWTEDKLERLEADTDKTINTVKSRVESVDVSCTNAKSDLKSFREEINEIRIENKKMNMTLIEHTMKLNDETEEIIMWMKDIEGRLEVMKSDLDTYRADVTMRVLPNMFNKGYAVFGIFLTFLFSLGAIFSLYNKYNELSQSLDELRQTTSLRPQ